MFDLGVQVDRVLHDCLHSQLLGTGKSANGSAIIFLAESGYWCRWPDSGLYQDQLELMLRAAHKHFLQWKKNNKMACSQPRFTPSRLSRITRMHYPSLSSKGYPSKVVTFWVTECCLHFAGRESATDLDKMVATCMRAYAHSLQIMGESGLVMTEGQANDYYSSVLLHLQSFAALHKLSRSATGKQVNRTCWKLLCKHHHYYHHAKETLETRINPSITQLLCAEDWVGRLGRIARATHKSNLSLRTLERYLSLVYLELAKV